VVVSAVRYLPSRSTVRSESAPVLPAVRIPFVVLNARESTKSFVSTTVSVADTRPVT